MPGILLHIVAQARGKIEYVPLICYHFSSVRLSWFFGLIALIIVVCV